LAPRDRRLTRRGLIQLGAGALGLPLLSSLITAPRRLARAAPNQLPEIQFDIADFLSPAENLDGTLFQLGPVFTLFVTGRLSRSPNRRDADVLASAFEAIENSYPYSPSGVFLSIAYGIPYFNRLPGGMQGELVSGRMPRLLLDRRRFALEEAVPAPTDVSAANPDIEKANFNIPVAIETNDFVITMRSDLQENLLDVMSWMTGAGELAGQTLAPPRFEGLIEFTSSRLMFIQRGTPRRLAESEALSYADRINPDSPMWMGFASQQVDSSGPAPITTFQGNRSAQFTDANGDSYFADGSVQHLSHAILDLDRWYADNQPYVKRVSQMFRSNPPPASGEDGFNNGGGPAFVANSFRGRDDARQNAIGEGTDGGAGAIGHTNAIQRASRAADGTAFHIRVDGPGYDEMDVPSGRKQPKSHFSIYLPSSEVFERMRRYQSAVDLEKAYGLATGRAGIEPFTTTTRRQNFLVPPRRHRAFPLVELL
jgi:hypothetical protein